MIYILQVHLSLSFNYYDQLNRSSLETCYFNKYKQKIKVWCLSYLNIKNKRTLYFFNFKEYKKLNLTNENFLYYEHEDLMPIFFYSTFF